MNRIATALSLASFVFATIAHAYVPNSRTIVSRLVKNSGKGVYTIEQDVNFRTTAEGLTLRERWVVEHGESMRLTVTSLSANALSVKFDILYRDGKRFGPDASGALKSSNLKAELIEPLFHARSSKGFFDTIARSGLVPSGFPATRPPFKMDPKLELKTPPPPGGNEANVRLSRVAGVVTYAFGEPTPADSSKALPGVWIEQDAFLLRKARFPSEAEVTADRFSAQSGGLKFPRSRVVTWGAHAAEIRLVSAKTTAPAQASQSLSAAAVQSESKNARLPTDEQVKEFYSRFR